VVAIGARAEEEGWFFRLSITDSSELKGLMDENAYKTFVDSL
jgi:glycine cleavage system H protein